MRLLGGFSVGRWFGFEVRIDYSWFLIFFLVVWTLSTAEFPRQISGGSVLLHYSMGTVAALLLFLSVLLHELSHSVVARARGLEVEGITLFIFGGVARTRMEARTAADEFLLTAAGPLSSLALGGIFYGLARLAGTVGWGAPAVAVGETLAVVNVALAVFNMIPGFPLDGGRIFRSVVWHVTGDVERATRWATRGGQGFGVLLVAAGFLFLWQGFLINGLWAAFIGWFLASAASSSWQHFRARRILAGVPVERVMTRDPVAVDADAPVARLVADYFMRRPYSAYPVVEGGEVVGLVALEDAAEVAPERRTALRARDVMVPLSEVPTAEPGETLDRVLADLGAAELDRALVVEDGTLAGIVTIGEIGGWLERARKLGLEDGTRRASPLPDPGRGPGRTGHPGDAGPDRGDDGPPPTGRDRDEDAHG